MATAHLIYKNALLLFSLTVQDPQLQIKLYQVLGQSFTLYIESSDFILLCL